MVAVVEMVLLGFLAKEGTIMNVETWSFFSNSSKG